jgi:predicted membrane-bound spermidine synthase
MRLFWAVTLATLSGFVALSYEIIWVRAFSYVSWGAAPAFGLLLGSYLAGLALGAVAARRYCKTSGASESLTWLAFYFLAANLVAYVLLPLLGELVRYAPYNLMLPVFALAAALLGTGFPLISHFGIDADAQAGRHLSYLYVGNILGSSAGSMLTGFVLMDVWSLREISVFLALAGLGLSAGMVLLSGRRRPAVFGLIGVSAAVVVLAAPNLFAGLYEKWQLKDEYEAGFRFQHVIETKSGVVCVDHRGTVYGGGVYDGRFNVDPKNDTNGVVRAYALAAVHDAPRDVLIIGLGSGSWAQVAVHHPAVERMTVVEINPGYVELMKVSPVVASLLQNDKVEFVVDDGRRWLQRSDRKFDAMIQNTTYHFRAHSTNLLSREYLELCRKRLKPGGVLIYNTTWSDMAQRTGAEVFPAAFRLMNCMYVGDAPFEPDLKRWKEILAAYRIDGRPVADPESARRIVENSIWEDRASILRRTYGLPTITDDNMASEWRPDPQTARAD